MQRTRDATPLAADGGAKQGQPGGMQPTPEPGGELSKGILFDETSRPWQYQGRAVESGHHYLVTPNVAVTGAARYERE